MGKDADILARFRDYLQYERGYSQYTVDGYLRDVGRFFRIYGVRPVNEVVPLVGSRDIRRWVLEEGQRARASRTTNRALSALRAFFDFSQELGLCEHNPVVAVSHPKNRKLLPLFLRREEVENLLLPFNYPSDWEGMRNRLLVLLLYSTGVRRGELVGLKWLHWDRRARTLRVLGKGTKERLVPTTNELGRELEAYREASQHQLERSVSSSDYILVRANGQALSVDMVYRIVNECYARMTDSGCRGAHVLRHTFATHMLGGGAEVGAIKELLGHASLASTQVYAHTDVDILKAVYKSAHPHGNNERT